MITIFCVSDEAVKCLEIKDEPGCKMQTSEVMTFAITSALFYECDYKKSRLIYSLQIFLRKAENTSFIVDSFPVKAYENHKSFRVGIFSEKIYHGYSASKKLYFFGLKIHIIVDSDGVPIEFMFTPGNCPDILALKNKALNLPGGSFVLGDKAYNSYEFEDALQGTK